MNNKGLYLWDFEVITHWNDEREEDNVGTDEVYAVSSLTFEGACKKVEKLVLSKSRKFVSERYIEGELVDEKFTFFPVSFEIIKVERGSWIDG